MCRKRKMYWLIPVVLASILGLGAGGKMEQEKVAKQEDLHRPIVRVVSPGGEGTGFVLDHGVSKILVTLEIVDVEDVGIVTDDSGSPRFFDKNGNVDVFLHHIVSKGTYTDGRGKTVIQLVSEIPIDQLIADKDLKMTPPVDEKKLTKQQREEGIEVPRDAMLEMAAFFFRVKDRSGATSWNEADPKNEWVPTFSLGFASGLYRPPQQSKSSTATTP